MSDKPKVDPFLTGGPPPGTRIRPEEAPKPRPKGAKRPPRPPSTPRAAVNSPPSAAVDSSSSAPASSSAPSTPTGPVVVGAELVEPSALIAASGNGSSAAAGLAASAPFGAPVKKKTRKEREMERIGELETQIWASSARILQHALAAADVPDDGSRPPGWSDRKWRTARDARLNRREIPGYVEMAGKVVESFKRSEALKAREGGGMPPALNGNITFYVNGDIKNTFNYPVMEQKDPE